MTNATGNVASSLIADPSFPILKAYLIEASGLAYYADKDNDLADKVGRRLAKSGVGNCTEYLNFLKEGEKGNVELDAVFAELTIGETYFFRHTEQFDSLRSMVVPKIIEKNLSSKRMRVWCAGCSVGAEPYSISIMLKKEFGGRIADWDIDILGTDINRDFLARAREGMFDEWAFRSTPEEIKNSCFTLSGSHRLIRPEYKEWVTFQYHNLARNPFPSLVNDISSFDLIFCRNVMIYFDREIVRKMIRQLGQCLTDEGWLFVGHAEPNIELFQSFRTLNIPGATLYQKSKDPDLFAARPESASRQPLPLPNANGIEIEMTAPLIGWEAPVIAPPQEETRPAPAPSNADLDNLRFLADRGDWRNAERGCNLLLKKDQFNPVLHFYHALVLEHVGSHDETEKALRRAIYLDRKYVLAHYYLGILLQKRWRTHEAALSFENVSKLLSSLAPQTTFPEADNIAAVDLLELTKMHLNVLRGL